MEKSRDKRVTAIESDHESSLVAGVSVKDVDASINQKTNDLMMTSFSGSHQGSPAVL